MNTLLSKLPATEDISDRLSLLGQEVVALEAVEAEGVVAYFAQEVLRFYSMAQSLSGSKLLGNETALDRQISHVLGRSLLEGFFWLVYIFDDPAVRQPRFAHRLDSFRHEYGKFWEDPHVIQRAAMEPAEEGWSSKPKKSSKELLQHVRNDAGQRLDYLYWIYRVASFDAHGNSMNALFQAVFEKDCSFSALDWNFGFSLMADHYLGIIQGLQEEGALAVSA